MHAMRLDVLAVYEGHELTTHEKGEIIQIVQEAIFKSTDVEDPDGIFVVLSNVPAET